MLLHLLNAEEQKSPQQGELRVCPKCNAEAVWNNEEWQCLNPDCAPTYHKNYHAVEKSRAASEKP